MLDFEKEVAGFGSSHIAKSSNDKNQLVELNIEKKINGIGFVNTKDVSLTYPKENNYFLEFKKETTGIGSAHMFVLNQLANSLHLFCR